MQQKVIQIGNSSGIIVPKELMAEIGIKTGSIITLEKDATGQGFFVSKQDKKTLSSSITPHFLGVVEKVNKKYSSALQELAGK
jgi:putative addiction module antidote